MPIDSRNVMRARSPLKAVIFDVDGTLVDSNDLHVEAWREAFAHYGIGLSHDQVHAQIGKGGDQLIPVFLSEDQVEQFGDALDRLRGQIFLRDYLPQVRPFPRVRELFEQLRADGLHIALGTSSKQVELETHVRNLDVEDLVNEATSADDAEHSKPCPDIFEAALGQLEGVYAPEAIVVGDTPFDVLAAARAGMNTVAVLTGGFAEDALRDAGAAAVYLDISDLLDHYCEWIEPRNLRHSAPYPAAIVRERRLRAFP
jgi:HAD superfamily hydrolase (TIGR01509 family)